MSDLDQKFFNEVSQAIQNEDNSKLSSLFEQETPEEEQPVEELPAEEPEVESQEEENEQPAEEAGDEQETEQKEEDPLAVLRAEIESLKKGQHEIKSQSGRVSSLQRRLAEYDKKLAEIDKATSSQASAKVKPEIEEALKELHETDPVLAKTIQAVMEKALGGVDAEIHTKERERIASLRDMDYQAYQEEQKEILLEKVPNVRDVFNSTSWKTWKQSQPKHVFELADADDAQAVFMALDIYKKDMLAQNPDLGKSAEAEKPVVVDERATKVEEERKRKQHGAVNLDSGKAPSRTKLPNNPEALFKQDFENIMKEITGK